MNKQKADRKILTIISILASIFVYTGAIGIYFYANGWRLDPINQQVIKTGVLTVESEPFLANLYIEGEDKGRTPRSESLTVGSYDISVYKTGYIEWKKNIQIKEEKSTPVFPWLIRDNIEKQNIFSLEDRKYINSWINETNDHLLILTSQQLVISGTYKYELWRFDINTAFWDLSSNPRVVLTFDSATQENISMTIAPNGTLAVMRSENAEATNYYLVDTSKTSTLETLTQLDIGAFSSYTISWSKDNNYLMFESPSDIISFNIERQTKYLLYKKQVGYEYIWSTDEHGFFYGITPNIENTNENIYAYTMTQTLMDGSNPKVILSDLYFQKNAEYIERYRGDTGDGKYIPFTNSPESTKSVGKLLSFTVNQNGNGIYIKSDAASYWYDINLKKYYLISSYSSDLIEFSIDNRKLIFKDSEGYSVFTFDKEQGDHTEDLGSKKIANIDTNASNVQWLSNSTYISYIEDSTMYISDKDGDNKVKILDNVDLFKYIGVTFSKEFVFTVQVGDTNEAGLNSITADSYLIH